MSEANDRNAYNRALIQDYRAHGKVTSGPHAGRPILLVTTTGAKSGLPRTTPLVHTKDGDRLVVIASKGGAPTHPDWYHNLVANPEVTVELGNDKFKARASIAEGQERERLYNQQGALMPGFAEYQKNTTRQIPVVVLERIG